MPKFLFTSPEGKEFEVEGPEGSTKADAWKQFKSKQYIPGGESGFEDFAEGVVASGMDTYYGAKDLLTDLTDEERERVRDWKADAGQSGWGTAGEITGEVAQLLAPGGAALKGAKALSKVKTAAQLSRAAKAALLGTDVAINAAAGYTRLPEEEESREGNASREAVGALAGAGLFKAIKGVSTSPAAKRLIAKGVKLTPGQASTNPLITGAESVGEVTPFLARAVKKAKTKSIDSMNKLLFKEATPPGAPVVTEVGEAGVRQLKAGFKDAYTDAWKGATELSTEGRVKMVNTVGEATPRLTEQQKGIMKTIGKDFKNLTKDPTPAKLQAFDNVLRKRISSASKQDMDFSEMLGTLRTQMREGIPDGVNGKLKAVDAKYGDYLVIRKGVKNAMGEVGREIQPKHLIAAVKSVGKDRAGEGTAPLYQTTVDAAETLGKEVGGQPLEWFRRIAGSVPGAPTDLVAPYAIGQGTGQKTMAKAIRKLEERGIRGSITAGPGATEYIFGER
jgi:hypothetical protein